MSGVHSTRRALGGVCLLLVVAIALSTGAEAGSTCVRVDRSSEAPAVQQKAPTSGIARKAAAEPRVQPSVDSRAGAARPCEHGERSLAAVLRFTAPHDRLNLNGELRTDLPPPCA